MRMMWLVGLGALLVACGGKDTDDDSSEDTGPFDSDTPGDTDDPDTDTDDTDTDTDDPDTDTDDPDTDTDTDTDDPDTDTDTDDPDTDTDDPDTDTDTDDPDTDDPDTDTDTDTDDPDTDTDTDDPDTGDTDTPPSRTYTSVGAWCLGEPTLGPGLYRGTVAHNLNEISHVPCVGAAMGREGSVRVDVGPGQTLTVTHHSLVGDAVLYLLDTCPVVNSCLAGADSSFSLPETVSWTNTSGVTNTVHVVLDHADLHASGAFELDIELH